MVTRDTAVNMVDLCDPSKYGTSTFPLASEFARSWVLFAMDRRNNTREVLLEMVGIFWEAIEMLPIDTSVAVSGSMKY